VQKGVRDWPVPTSVVQQPEEKYAAFAVSDVALAASGTVAVELAVAGVPTVIAYRVSPVSAALARRLIHVRYASLVNILLDREVQPEFLQGKCRPNLLARKLGELLYDPAAREAQLEGAREAVDLLRPGDVPPSHRAAETLLSLIDAGGEGRARYIEGQQR
jgi:lipid-A-disaccharide synthase